MQIFSKKNVLIARFSAIFRNKKRLFFIVTHFFGYFFLQKKEKFPIPWRQTDSSVRLIHKKESRTCDSHGGGGRDRTNDLQVMSLTSYHCSTPRYSSERTHQLGKSCPPSRASLKSGCKGTAFFSIDQIFTRKNAQKLHFSALFYHFSALFCKKTRKYQKFFVTLHSENDSWAS